MTNGSKQFEKTPNASEIFRAAFPIHENLDWSMPAFEDPEFLAKMDEAPLWGNQFRKDDVDTIMGSLGEMGFSSRSVARELQTRFEEAGRPSVQKDLRDNPAGEGWRDLVSSLLHIVTTYRFSKKFGYKPEPAPKNLILSPEDRARPLEERHGLQNNIAVKIIISKSEKFTDLKDKAQKVVTLFNKPDKTPEDRWAMLHAKLELEKSYFQKQFPDFSE